MDHCEREKRVKNPRDQANIFSLLTFAYTGGLFAKAYKNDLEEEDLYEVLEGCTSKSLGDGMEKQWILQNKNGKPSVVGLIWNRFGYRYILVGLVHLASRIIQSIVEPYAVSNLIGYFKPGQTALTTYDAYYYAGVVMILNVCHCLYMHSYIVWVEKLGIEVRTSFSSLLYRKALKLTPTALSDISLGNIVTLITKDVQTFYTSVWFVNDTWIGILQTFVICYLLYSKMGVSAFIGIGVIVSIMPIQVYLGAWISKLRLQIGRTTDERLQVTQETLSTIRIIKMYTWEKYFDDKVNAARREETNKMLIGFYLRIVIISVGVLSSKAGFYLLVMAYVWMGNTTNTELIFYILAVFKDLRRNLCVTIPMGMGEAAELISSAKRINKVINAEELHPKFGNDEPTDKPLVEIKGATAHIKEFTVLKNVSFGTNSGLTLITGTVGSGKSSLLKAILQDYPLTTGSLVTCGRISYASQDPWLFPSSIKQNILFTEKYDEKRYEEVLNVCALRYDLSLFDKGDQTIVADKGLNLSKGQQARINLARAIYKDSEIYLLDDSLTALDAHVQDYIFKECIKKFLKDKICILVTQTSNQIQQADNVVIMDHNQIKFCGRPNENVIHEIVALVSKEDNAQKSNVEKTNEKLTDDEDEEEEASKLIKTKQTAKKKIYSEVKKEGEVDAGVYNKYFMFGGGIFFILFILVVFVSSQGTDSYSEKLVSKWVDKQQRVLDLQNNVTLITQEIFNKMNKTSGNNSSDGRNYTTILEEAISEEQFTINLYSAIIFIATSLGLVRTYCIFDFCRRASMNLHRVMSDTIINAVMSFFDAHFIGNILNRFSQDLYNIDENLPFVFFEVLRHVFATGGIVMLMASVNWIFLIPFFFFFALLTFVRKMYLPTGRSLKRLEAATRSPMVGHLNSSLEGLTTIRAYKAQHLLSEEFDRHQDLYTSANFTSVCTGQAFGFCVDSLCSVFIGLIVARFVFLDTDASAGNVGLVLTQSFMLASFVQFGIHAWSDLEKLMTSVERVLEYTEIPKETIAGVEVNNWPTHGAITYEDVSLTYSNNEKVLKNLNFTIQPKEKIGIVGRTGAGKSSIISTLFRLYDVEGRILIDGIDIKTLSLRFLRQRIAIIPQDPILFNGTVRSNIDPLGDYTDEELWAIFGKVNLKPLVDNLNMKVKDGGANFSAGQKQLFCLARALIRKTKIVILDEATANMDHDTDALLHKTITDNFRDCTVFTIAHRLHSILNCDRVLVLDRGVIKQFDAPRTLLKDNNGIFYKMVEQSDLLDYLS